MKIHALVFCVILGSSALISNGDQPFIIRFPQDRILQMLTNKDIYWEGDYAGLTPYLSPNAQALIPVTDLKTAEEIKTWLQDPNRFVVAHVLLTLSDNNKSFKVSSSEWNALKVKLFGNGEVEYGSNQIEKIVRHWKNNKPSL